MTVGPRAAVARQSFLRLIPHIILAGLTFVVIIARNEDIRNYERHAEIIRRKKCWNGSGNMFAAVTLMSLPNMSARR